MKKIVLLVVCIAVFTAQGFAQGKYAGEKGVSSVGAMLGYAIDNETLVIGLDYRYNVLDKVRVAPSILYLVKNNDLSTWYFNADGHYLLRMTDRITVYPIGGLGISAWNIKYKYMLEDMLIEGEEVKGKKESDSKMRIGLNMGFGGEIRLTKDIIIGAEFKYNLTNRHYDQAMFLARAAYYF